MMIKLNWKLFVLSFGVIDPILAGGGGGWHLFQAVSPPLS